MYVILPDNKKMYGNKIPWGGQYGARQINVTQYVQINNIYSSVSAIYLDKLIGFFYFSQHCDCFIFHFYVCPMEITDNIICKPSLGLNDTYYSVAPVIK